MSIPPGTYWPNENTNIDSEPLKLNGKRVRVLVESEGRASLRAGLSFDQLATTDANDEGWIHTSSLYEWARREVKRLEVPPIGTMTSNWGRWEIYLNGHVWNTVIGYGGEWATSTADELIFRAEANVIDSVEIRYEQIPRGETLSPKRERVIRWMLA